MDATLLTASAALLTGLAALCTAAVPLLRESRRERRWRARRELAMHIARGRTQEKFFGISALREFLDEFESQMRRVDDLEIKELEAERRSLADTQPK